MMKLVTLLASVFCHQNLITSCTNKNHLYSSQWRCVYCHSNVLHRLWCCVGSAVIHNESICIIVAAAVL